MAIYNIHSVQLVHQFFYPSKVLNDVHVEENVLISSTYLDQPKKSRFFAPYFCHFWRGSSFAAQMQLERKRSLSLTAAMAVCLAFRLEV